MQIFIDTFLVGKSLAIRYASCKNHEGKSSSRGDDVESLSYTLLYLYHGELPWIEKEEEEVKRLKCMEELRAWCKKNGTPRQLLAFIEYAQGLEFGEKPDYNFFKDKTSL